MNASQQHLVRTKTLGAEWRERFAQVAFVGEVEVDESLFAELRELFGYGEVWSQRLWDEDVRVAFAVLVVNLAYYAPSDQTKKSLSKWVCEQLGYEYSQDTWENLIGDPVTRVFKDYFGVALRSGAFRYVTPINQQAGINATAVKLFAGVLHHLLSKFGAGFSETEYKSALELGSISSAPFVEFLQTPAGYIFSKEIARNVANVLDGVYDWDALKRRSAFRGHLLERLQQVLEGGPKRNTAATFPKPRLAVDRIEQQLVVLFGDPATFKHYRWATNKPVVSHRHELAEAEFGQTLSGSVRSASGSVTSWEVRTWSPAVSPWALFRLSDGVFLSDRGPIRPGRYLLAVPSEIDLAKVVDEDFGEMYLPGQDTSIRLVDCTLPAGYAIPEIELGVDESCAAAPWLRFDSEQAAVRGTTNVFRGELPQVEVVNWTESFCDEFAVVLSTAEDRAPIRSEMLRKGPRCRVNVKGDLAGSLTIEPIGRVPKDFVEAPLAFVVVPRDFEISIEEGLRGDHAPVRIEISCSDPVDVRWRQKQVAEVSGGTFVVPGDLDLVEGVVTAGSARFDVALRIPRLSIHGSAFTDWILWADALDEDRQFEVAVSQAEVGTNPKLVLALSSETSMPILTLPPIPKSARRHIKVADVCGALTKFQGIAGRFALRLQSGQTVFSRALFVDANAVERWVMGNVEEQALAIEIFPDAMREALVALRKLDHMLGRTTTIPIETLPDRLRPVAERIVSCALAFDHGFEPETNSTAPAELGTMLQWYLRALKVVDLGDEGAADAARMLAEAPRDLSGLPFERWRHAVADAIELLRQVADVERAVREWAELCRQERWAEARASGLGARTGGDSLTSGAERYYWVAAIASEGGVVPPLRLGAALSEFHSAAAATTSESVRSTALVLAALCYAHAGHPKAESEIAILQESIGSQWRRAVAELQQYFGMPATGDLSTNGLSIADLSPHDYDATLFASLDHKEGAPRARPTARTK